MNIKKLSTVETVLDFNEVASALFKENNINIQSEEDFRKLFPDQYVEDFDNVSLADCIGNMYPLLKSDEFVSKIMSLPKGEKISILSDYDADGICSALIMRGALETLGFVTTLYIPDRLEGGYGSFDKSIISKQISSGFKHFITLDCGISMRDTAAEIMRLGGEVIITDHHLPGDEVPENCLIIDPKYNNDESADICGAMVAFKLVYALAEYSDENYNLLENYIQDFAFLAGVATVTDMMPMLGENRVFVKYALSRINNSKNNQEYYKDFVYFFASSLGCFNFLNNPDTLATVEVISYYIGPTLNAVSRVGEDVVDLIDDIYSSLMTRKGNHYIHSKVAANYTRRARTKELIDAYQNDEVEKVLLTDDNLTIVNFDQSQFSFPITGLFGIVANKLTNSEHKVTLIGTEVEDGIVSFSSRSEPGYNLHEAMDRISAAHPEYCIDGGGHAQAMGVRLKEEYLEDFFHDLGEDIKEHTETIEPSVYEFTDEELDDVAGTIAALAPYGQGFHSLTFLYRGKYYGPTSEDTMYNIGSITMKAYLTDEDKYLLTKDEEATVLLTANFASKQGVFFNYVRESK